MKKIIWIILILLIFMMHTENAYSFGEGFKIETVGIEYCGNYNKMKFTETNNVDLFVYFYSDTELLVSFAPSFQEEYSFWMYGYSYIAGASNAAFVGSAYFEDGTYATIQGKVTFNESGVITGAKGVFIQTGVIRSGCFSKGSFYTTKRLF